MNDLAGDGCERPGVNQRSQRCCPLEQGVVDGVIPRKILVAPAPMSGPGSAPAPYKPHIGCQKNLASERQYLTKVFHVAYEFSTLGYCVSLPCYSDRAQPVEVATQEEQMLPVRCVNLPAGPLGGRGASATSVHETQPYPLVLKKIIP